MRILNERPENVNKMERRANLIVDHSIGILRITFGRRRRVERKRGNFIEEDSGNKKRGRNV